MARKPTGKVIKNRAQVLQKNGDIYIYIYERESEIIRGKFDLKDRLPSFHFLPVQIHRNVTF